jgi:hypothetical protein
LTFDLSDIEYSHSDIKRNIKLPSKLTADLAEFIGIMIGDGHLGFYSGKYRNGKGYVKREISISGNSCEKNYLFHINNLFYKLFNHNFNYVPEKYKNALLLRANSKSIHQFLNIKCEIPLNCKHNIVKIPFIIKKSKNNIKYAFLRGLADTDFSVTFKKKTYKKHEYPVIKASFKSKKLINDLEILFKELGFKFCTCYDEKKYDPRFGYTYINNIYLNGKKNLKYWINEIGFSNSKFIRKIKKWLKDGYCPPGY